MAFLVGLLLAVFAGAVLAAAPTCYTYTVGYAAVTARNATYVGASGSQAAICPLLAANWVGYNDGFYTWQAVTGTWEAVGTYGRCSMAVTRRQNSNGAITSTTANSNSILQGATATCPPEPCDAYAGKKVTYAQNFASFPAVGSNFNIPVAGGCGADMTAASSCSETSGGGWFCLVTYSYTGDPPEPSPTAPAGTAAECAVVQGKQNCAVKTNEDTGQTCGTFNGERMCFPVDPTTDPDGQPPSGACWSTSGGGLLCADDVDVEDGEGDPVAPTQVLVTGSSTSNYYDSTTISENSVTTVITGQGPMGSETPGPESDCEGADCLEGGNMDSATAPGVVAGDIMGRIGAAPIVAAVSGLGGSLEGGTCPAWATTVEAGAFGTYELDFSFICGMWEDIAPIIAAVMLAGWALLAIRILMSA